MKKLIIYTTVLFLLGKELRSQVILSEGFEGPLSGWTNQGSVVGTQNNVTPHAGGGMAALGTANVMTSSNFTLPSGDKHISFWINEYNNSPFGGYTISADLLQNGSSVKNLGTWKDIAKWTYVAADYLSGYSGNNFSISFTVQSFIDPNMRFYIDDIKVASGFSEVGVEELGASSRDLCVTQDITKRAIRITSHSLKGPATIEICDLHGQVVLSNSDYGLDLSSQLEIDLSKLASGVYVLNVNTISGRCVKKILLQ